MSAWDLTGAIVCSPLAVLFFVAAIIPESTPEKVAKYGDSRRATCLLIFIPLFFAAVFCICRLNGYTI